MKTKVYTYDNNYKAWAQNNPEVEHLILEGKLPYDELDDFVFAFAEVQFKSIDISNFTIEIDGKNYEENYCLLWDKSYWKITNLGGAYPLQKALFNKEFANSFHWQNGYLLDDTGTVVIDTENKENIEVPPSISVIGHMAFAFMEEKSYVKLPDTLHTIGHCAFFDSEMREIYIPNSVKRIGESAFGFCMLEKVHLPENLEIIPFACFEANDIECIDFPKTLKIIEANAFMCCIFLRQVDIPEGVEQIDYNAFSGRICRKIKLPSTLKTLDQDFYYEECVEDPESCVPYIEVHPDNPYFFSKDGNLYSRDNDQKLYLGFPYVKNQDDMEPNPNGDCSCCPCHIEYSKEAIDNIFAQFLEEAKSGNAEKQNVISCMYTSDNWIKHDYEQAFYWAIKSAEQGYIDAMNNLADAYYLGTWLDQDYLKAVEWLRKAVDKGSARAMNNLATCYEEGHGVEKNLHEALRLYLLAAENNYDTEEDVNRLRSLLK